MYVFLPVETMNRKEPYVWPCAKIVFMAKSSFGFDSVKHASVSIHKKTHKNQESWNEIWNSKEVVNIAKKNFGGIQMILT